MDRREVQGFSLRYICAQPFGRPRWVNASMTSCLSKSSMKPTDSQPNRRRIFVTTRSSIPRESRSCTTRLHSAMWGNSTAYISIALGAHSAEKQGSHQRTFTNKHSAWRAFSRKIRQPSEDVYESAAAARRALDDEPYARYSIQLRMREWNHSCSIKVCSLTYE